MSKTFSGLPLSNELDFSIHEKPERALLRAVLGRAIYDLTPEATPEARKSAIQWFKAPPKKNPKKEQVTSFERIKSELELGFKLLGLIEKAVEEGEDFEAYRVHCKQRKLEADVQYWMQSRDKVTHISYRKLSYAEVGA